MSERFVFFERVFPSANMTLVLGERPVLIDSGFGSDYTETVALLRQFNVDPKQLQLIANTHYHCDHVGGNHGFQRDHGVPVAAHHWDARLINRRDRDACAAEWLSQPVESYTVDQLLHDGDVIDTGDIELQVLHTPGHTLGHLAFYADGVLIAGDTFHDDDVAWLNIFREGAGSLDRMIESLDRLAALPLRKSFSGHGGVCEQPHERIDQARARYEKWARAPEKIGWHACKRIFAYALMLTDGMDERAARAYLLAAPWFHDFARYSFNAQPEDFVTPLLNEIIRSGAARWRGDQLVATAPYNAPSPSWLRRVLPVHEW